MRARLGQRKDPPNEYVIVVGGPSNPYTGYVLPSGAPSPAPLDSSIGEVRKYILPPGSTPTHKPQTHDRYWAGFIYSAVKLVETGRLRPERGDILTLIVYLPAYYLRNQTDWMASPCNPRYQWNFWVRGRPYDPHAVHVGDALPADPDDPRRPDPPSPPPPRPPVPVPPDPQGSNVINFSIFMWAINDIPTGPNAPVPSVPIWPDGGFPRLMWSPSQHMQKVLDVPVRLAVGSRYVWGTVPDRVNSNIPPLRGVSVRMLFLDDDVEPGAPKPPRTASKLLDYLATGFWKGPRYRSPLEGGTEESATRHPKFYVKRTPDGGPGTAGRVESVSMTHFVSGNEDPNAATWTAFLPPDLLGTEAATDASIDRTHIKIKQLHYFGHSGGHDNNQLFPRYGWENDKGELPAGEIVVHEDELNDALANATTSVFAPKSLVKLWSCHLARPAGQSSMAKMFASYASEAVGATGFVAYSPVIDPGQPDAMPAPSDVDGPGSSVWLTFSHP